MYYEYASHILRIRNNSVTFRDIKFRNGGFAFSSMDAFIGGSIFRTRAGARGRRAIFIQSNARKSARIIIDIINTFIIIVAAIPKRRGIFVRLIIRQVCRPAAPATKSESFNSRARRSDSRSIDAIFFPPAFRA